MKDLVIIPTIPTVNLTNLNRSPSNSNPCSPSTKFNNQTTPYEFDGCMLCVNGTPSCLQKRRATWTLKLRVALYCLSVLHPEKKYFNLKKDIYTYVDSHWDYLSINTAKSDRWRKQVQDSLSHCRHFESGWDAMGCNGHWRLIHPLNPWSLPPEKESQMGEDEDSIGSMTPDAGLSPRNTKSPREDPLYRNFPKRRPGQQASSVGVEEVNSTGQDSPMMNINDNVISNPGNQSGRKRKDEDRYTEEELLLLKYSPMIFSDTPSPKCRTPRSSQTSTSPSILGNSPLLTSNGSHFSLSNFYNNLNINTNTTGTPSVNNTNNNNTSTSINYSNITILDNNTNSSCSPPTSPSMKANSSPPVPTNPFASSWKPNTTTNLSPVLFGGNDSDSVKFTPLPNPFSVKNSNSNLKVPSELLLKSSAFNANQSNTQSRGDTSINTLRETNAISTLLSVASGNQSMNSVQSTSINTTQTTTINNNSNNSSSIVNQTTTQQKLTKLQQQNLILNCTY